MQEHYEVIRARGADLVAIGQGTGEEAARFCRQLGAAFPCLGDPVRESYRAYGLPRGGWRAIVLDPLRDPRARRFGFEVNVRGSLLRESDWFQLPGVAIVDQGGVLRHLHRARHSGDLPPPAEILAALDALGG